MRPELQNQKMIEDIAFDKTKLLLLRRDDLK